MDQSTLQKFKTSFEKEKQNLLYSHQVLNDAFQLSQEELSDEVDLTSTEMEQSMRIRLRNREALYLKKIEEALERIEEGTFGLCEECEEPINQRRLQARPTATLCVSCKEEQEQKESHFIDGRRSKSIGEKWNAATG